MKKGRVFLALLILVIGTSFSLRAQRFDTVLNVLETRYTQEKIYLHFDKAVYNPGETIWFKAYLFTANFPSLISKTVYADLIDEKGKLIQRKISPVMMSSASAAFDLPADLASSVVYVRAYTDWMLNFDSSFLFMKALPILQQNKTAGKETTAKATTGKETVSKETPGKTVPAAPKTFLQFFPEGGDLIDGVQARVAFKATDNRGMPKEVKGEILSSKGKSVASFSSIHDGMGFFIITPEAQEQYKASWKDESGKAILTPLPASKKSGMSLNVNQTKAGIQFIITRPEGEVKPDEFVYVVGQMQQQMVYMAKANIAKARIARGTIPLDNIPGGILQISIFTEDEKPLAERIVFVNKQDYYFITDLNAALKGFDKRKKNVIQIDVPDTLRSNLSVSVTDADINPVQSGDDDIFSNVLLTSDIKGYVHHPAYYFSSEADSVAAHLDLVMMTNGWRRFNWVDVLAGRFPKINYLPENYLSFKGRINGLTKGQLTNKELTGILEIDKKQQFLNIPVQTDGTFDVTGMVFFDTAKLFYQFNNDKEKVLTSRASFDIRNNLLVKPPDVKPDTNSVFRYTLPDPAALAKNKDLAAKNRQLLEDQRKKVETLASVTVVAKQKSKKDLMDEEYTSGLFAGGDGYTFLTDDDPFAKSALSVFTYLQGKVAGLQITVNGNDATLSWRGGSPTIFLNEMQTDVSQIQSINMNDVAMIKVFRPPFFGATGGGSGGAIAIYTKKGAAANQDVKGLDFAKIPGYSPVKQFYSPDYMRYDESHTQGDYRPTLYWNPYILTDKDSRRVLFTFYNNDVTRRFRVVIEGCNEEGKLTRIEKIFDK